MTRQIEMEFIIELSIEVNDEIKKLLHVTEVKFYFIDIEILEEKNALILVVKKIREKTEKELKTKWKFEDMETKISFRTPFKYVDFKNSLKDLLLYKFVHTYKSYLNKKIL